MHTDKISNSWTPENEQAHVELKRQILVELLLDPNQTQEDLIQNKNKAKLRRILGEDVESEGKDVKSPTIRDFHTLQATD